MTDYKIWLGYLAVVLKFIGYYPYFKDLLQNKTRPHIFSWLLWGIIEAIIFAIQVNQNAGPGAWVSGATALICFTVAALSYKKGLKDFPIIDWILLSSSLFSLLLWWYTKNPLGSVILLIITDACGFAITVRKTYNNPHSETLVTYIFSALKSFIAIFALQTYNPSTWLFLAYLGVSNTLFVITIYLRRQQLLNK